MSEPKIQLLNYGLISVFKHITYKDMLFDTHISGSELFISKCKDEYGQDDLIEEFVYPLKLDRKTFAVPSKYVNLLPIEVIESEKISVQNKAYHLVKDCEPTGFGAIKSHESFRDFVDNFCVFEHEESIDFLLWKLIMITAYIGRINVRVSTEPSFAKDSIINITRDLMGDVGKVSTPTIAKIEWLLTNKVIVTNEVSGIKEVDRVALEPYYKQCGDFNLSYEKRSLANYKGSKNTYDLSKLSNVICYNNLDTQRKKDKYFDRVFSDEVLDRFIPFKLKGRLLECFSDIRFPKKIVQDNIDYYKNIIKTFKYYEENPDVEIKEFKYTNPFKRGSRYFQNWSKLMITLDKYSQSQEDFTILSEMLYLRYKEYQDMVDRDYEGNKVKEQPMMVEEVEF